MSTYQQQLAKCKDTNDDYSNIWRSSVWTITDYEELFVDIDRGYIIQSQGWGKCFIINPEWEEEEEEIENVCCATDNCSSTVSMENWSEGDAPREYCEDCYQKDQDDLPSDSEDEEEEIENERCGVCDQDAYHQNDWHCSQGLIGPKIKEWFDVKEEENKCEAARAVGL